ncbi:MAG: protein kinase [Acidobacteriota bacterium]
MTTGARSGGDPPDGEPTRVLRSEGSGTEAPKVSIRYGFAAEEILAGRFRVVRRLGAGGMGEVYEAEDLELRERVAVKVVRHDLAGDPMIAARFRREVQLARQVTHPSVCRIYDVFHHGTPGGRELLLSMQLLVGETLSARLVQDGPLALEEVEPLARQIASALAAAHRRGVVHRDLKASNVMLVDEGGGTTRAVLTDFGLARSVESAERNLTGGGDLVGSLKTMAPEQLEGGAVTPATDVYAFGLLLFRMLCGRRLFEGPSGSDALTMVYRRLHDEVPSLGESAAVPPAVDRLVRRCLARAPEDRFADGAALEAAVDAAFSDSERVPEAWIDGADASRSRTARGRWTWLVGLAGLGLAAAAWWTAQQGSGRGGLEGPSLETAGSQEATVPRSAVARPSVAVVAVRRLSPRTDDDWLEVALPEMLSAEVAAGAALRVLPQDQVALMRRELGLDGVELDAEQRRRVRRYLGADALVWGSSTAVGAGQEALLRLDLKAEVPKTEVPGTREERSQAPSADAEQSAPASDAPGASEIEIAFVTAEGRTDELFDIVRDAGERLRRVLGAAPLGDDARRALAAETPSSPRAAALYARGLDALRRGDAPAARDALLQVLELEPDLSVAHGALAEAWGALGRDDDALAAARRAFENAGPGREQVLAAEARLRRAEADWSEAEAIFATLFRLRPDDLDAGLALAEVQVDGGRGQAALETVAALRALPTGEDPRIDLVAAAAFGALSQHDEQSRAADAAITAARRLGTRSLEARGLLERSEALRVHERWDDAVAAVRAAQAIYDETGSRRGVAQTLNELGVLWWRRDELEQAAAAFESAAEITSELGDRRGAMRARGNAAMVLDTRGDRERAHALYEEVLEEARALGDTKSASALLVNLGIVERAAGALDAAQQRFEQALELKRGIGDRGGVSRVHGYLGRIALDRGRGDAALEHLARSAELAAEIGDRRGEAFALHFTTIAQLRLAPPAAALEAAERAASAARDIESPRLIAGGLQLVAQAQYGLDQLAAARATLDEAGRVATESGAATELATVQATRAAVELDAGDARRAIELVEQALAATEEPRPRAELLALRARAEHDVGAEDAERATLEELDALLEGDHARALATSRARIVRARLRGDVETLERLAAEAAARGEHEAALRARIDAARLREEPATVQALAERADEAGFVLLARLARGGADR